METLVEQIVTMPIVDPTTGDTHDTFTYAGRVDLVDGDRLIDWKTVADPKRFIEQKVIGYQAERYAVALNRAGVRISEIEYRLITRPTIRLGAKDVGPKAYEERCVEWLRQDEKLVTHTIFLNPSRFGAAQKSLFETAQRINQNRASGYWLQNEYACYTFNRACDYLPLCMIEANGGNPFSIARETYRHVAAHPEIDNDSKNILTHSSACCFSTCEKKYFWRYEQGFEPDGVDAEALWIGNAAHKGLEAMINGGVDAGLDAISEWAENHVYLGIKQANEHDQQVARARAIVRVAAEKWLEGLSSFGGGVAASGRGIRTAPVATIPRH